MLRYLSVHLLVITALPATAPDSREQCTYSFFFFTYRQPIAAKFVFDRIRGFHPSAPIYILTDVNGIDLSEFCTGDNACRSTRSTIRFGHAYRSAKQPMTNHSLQQLFSYFNYFAEAAHWGGCRYIMQVEEDVWYNRSLYGLILPPGDAGGGNTDRPGDRYSVALQEYLSNQSGKRELGVVSYIAGGSYFRSAALNDCVKNILRNIDWPLIHSLDKRVAAAWDTVPALLFLLGGYRTAFWPEICDRMILYSRAYKKPCWTAAIYHSKVNNPARKKYRKFYKSNVLTYSDVLHAEINQQQHRGM